MFIYEWKPATCIKADPNVAAEVFDELTKTVGLTPENLVNASAEEDAPLHNEFEWNDEKAAEKYRVHQAGHLIRSIVVKSVPDPEDEEKPVVVRAYMQAGTENYEPIRVISSDEEKRSILLDRALRELVWFKNKYSVLSELASVFTAIDALMEADNEV